MRDPSTVRSSRVVAGILVGWFAVATLVVASGLLQQLRPPAPQLVLVALTALTLMVTLRTPTLRRWSLSVDARVLVAPHAARVVGLWFLVLYRRGELPWAFAVPGGWGDMVVAALALALLVSGPIATRGRWRALAAWNALGLLDILLVVATAARLALHDPASMQALLRWPLGLVPTFLVPIIIATHVLLAVRLARQRSPEGAPALV
jgi:hypothetical protein